MRPRLVAACLAALLLLAAGSAGWFYLMLWGGRSESPVELEIAPGSSAREVLDTLHEAGLLPSTFAARVYLELRSRDRNLHYGRYRFASCTRPVDVLEGVLEGRVAMFEITIVEGTDLDAIALQFEDLGVGTHDRWQDLAARTRWLEPEFSGAPSLEGFLFPDTYRFAIGVPADTAARHLVDRFLSVWRQERAVAGDLWGDPLEVVTLASLVEAETSEEAERELIAGVFVNRLRRGMLLQCDPTVVYALKRRGEWRGRLLRVHWQVEDPYNTYRRPGLPPGPINSPGRAALQAACSPAATPYLYFVARPGGGHAFSTSLAEHNRAVARLRAAGR